MATLERIRNKAGILITIFIGLALFAFILTDFLSSGKTIFKKASMDVGEIDGSSISIQEYQNRLSEIEEWTKLQYGRASLDENTTHQIQDQTWEMMVREKILTQEYEKLGIEVTDDEMLNMLTGKDVHPGIRQMFTDPQTGIFDGAMVIESLKRKKEDPRANFYWDFMLKQLKDERLYSKYIALLKKGMYVTTAQAKLEAEAKKKAVDFDFIVKRYSTVSDSSIAVSDSEIKNYYKKNIKDFKQEASRDIQYITFDVVPSEEDKQKTAEAVEKAKVKFADAATDPVQFINMNSDNAPYRKQNLTLEQVNNQLRLFIASANVGEVYGPYQEGESFMLTKLVAIKSLPDSAKARHILVRAEEMDAEKKADSLLALAKSGSDFATLARNNSQDPGSAVNGGDLGWFKEGMMVPTFNDACFGGKKGDIVKVESQFGWHIIHIQDLGKATTKYELATYEKKVTFSQKTYQQMYADVNKFAATNDTREKFEKAVKDQNLTVRYGRDIVAGERRLGALESPRELIKWAHEASISDLSPIYEFGNQFVLAVLTGAKEEGTTPVSEVKNLIVAELAKEKKAAAMTEEFNKAKSSGNLNAIAQQMGLTVQSASQINFAAFQVMGAGVEPALVGLATGATSGVIAGPVKGENGVYLITVTNVAEQAVSEEGEKAQAQQTAGFKVDYQAYESLKKNIEITDKRSKFY